MQTGQEHGQGYMDTDMEAPRTRTLEDLGIAVMRRGSYDEAAALGLHPVSTNQL